MQRFDVGRAPEQLEPADGPDTEQRDQHAELGVARAEHVADEHDPEREQRSETAGDRDRRGHHRAHERDREHGAEAQVLGRPAVDAGRAVGKTGQAGDERGRPQERRGVDEEDQRVGRVQQRADRQRGNEREQRRTQRDGPVRRAEHEPVGERQVLVVDEVADRRIACREEHEARRLEREGPDVDPPELSDEGHQRHHARAREVHGHHRPAPVPS